MSAAAIAVTLHTETVSKVTLTDLRRGGVEDMLVSLKFGDDLSAVSLLGQHGDVRELIVKALLELTRLQDEYDQSDELKALINLLCTGEE
jgi:hypothetical protein